DHGEVVGRDGIGDLAILVLAEPRPDQERGNEGERPTLQVYDAGAGIVACSVAEAPAISHLCQPTAAPDPAPEDWVNDGADEKAEEEEAAELPPLGAGAGDDGSGGVHEHHHEEEPDGDGAVVALAGEEVAGVADEAPAE